jgi:hypothetical protein
MRDPNQAVEAWVATLTDQHIRTMEQVANLELKCNGTCKAYQTGADYAFYVMGIRGVC